MGGLSEKPTGSCRQSTGPPCLSWEMILHHDPINKLITCQKNKKDPASSFTTPRATENYNSKTKRGLQATKGKLNPKHMKKMRLKRTLGFAFLENYHSISPQKPFQEGIKKKSPNLSIRISQPPKWTRTQKIHKKVPHQTRNFLSRKPLNGHSSKRPLSYHKHPQTIYYSFWKTW